MYVRLLKILIFPDLDHILSHSKDAQHQNSIWTAWHQELSPLVTNFSSILLLVDKAAEANGYYLKKIIYPFRIQ